MNRKYSSPRCILLILFLLFSFIGCGGGGGGSSSDGGDGGDGGGGNGSITYAGLTTPAAISEANAEDFVFGSLLGLEIGGYFSLSTDSSGGKSIDNQGQSNSIHPLAINLPLVLNNSAKNISYAHSRKNSYVSIASTETNTINGNCGGTATYTINVNDTTGSYDGTFIYKQYCEDGIVISGDTDINGTLNLATGDIITIAYVFDNLTVDEFIFKGNIFVNAAVTPQIITLDLLVKDSVSNKVYWAKEYSILITEINATDSEMEVTGTYYDPDQGYVTVSTPEPLLVSTEDWPILGALLCIGDKNTKARLTAINDYSYRIEADTNGDNVYNYDSGVLIWPGAPLPSPWQQKASMPTPRSDLGSGAIGSKVYVIGGYPGLGAGPTNVNEEYDPLLNLWSTKSPIPSERQNFGIGVVNDKIYVIGGITGIAPNTGQTNIVEEYNAILNSWITKSPMPTARSDFAVAVSNGKVYAIGGMAPDSMEEYDPVTDSWTSKASMPTPRYSLSVSVFNGKIYAIGGIGAAGVLDIVEEYDPNTNMWASKATMPTKRADLVSVTVGENIYAIGGRGSGVVERYNPTTNSWVSKANMPQPCYSKCAASVVNDKIYVFGVWINYSQVYEYDPTVDP